MMKVVVLVTMLAFTSTTFAAIYEVQEPCPDGRKPGEKWNMPVCQRCQCGRNSYYCYGCSIKSLDFDTTKCYLQFTSFNGSFPECCTPTVFCKGKPGFNTAIMNP